MTFSCGRSIIVMQLKKTNKQQKKKKTPKNQENKDGDLLVISD